MKPLSRTCLRCFFYAGIFIFFACNNNNKPQTIASAAEMAVNDSVLGRTIYIPDSMEAYVPHKNDVYMDSAQLLNAPYKIFSFINVSCVSCIPDIDKWDSVADEFMKHGVPVVLICDAKDNFEYLKYLFEEGKLKRFRFPLFLDSKNTFYKKNNFIRQDLAHQAVLTDAGNKIIAAGSAIYSDKIKAGYLQKVTGK